MLKNEKCKIKNVKSKLIVITVTLFEESFFTFKF